MYPDYSSFENLTKAASIYLEDIGRSKQTIVIYNWIWGKIKTYMDYNHVDSFTSNTITDYLSITYGNKSISGLTHHEKHCLRCALCLAQFWETNEMVEVIQRRETIVFTGEIGELMTKYIECKKSLRLNEKTLRGYSWYLYQFSKYLNEFETYNPDLLSPLKIMKYAATLLPNAAGAKHLALSIIKNFLRYLYDEGKTRKDLSLIVPRDNYKQQPRLPSIYTKEEVLVILNSIDVAVMEYIKKVLARNEYPEKNYSACQGIINYKQRVGATRLINACKRADSFNVYNFGIIERILKSKADFIPLDQEQSTPKDGNNMPHHDNIRGEDYYQ